MNKSKLILLSIVFSLLFNGCVSIIEPIVPAKTEQPEITPTEDVPRNTNTPTILLETATPTEEPVVDTPTQTIVPTETLVPTPTEILPVEWDIDPYIVKDIVGEYKGVKIKARLIIDRSLEPIIKSVEVVNADYFAKWLLQDLAEVWYMIMQGNEDTFSWLPYQRNKWFELWAKAQETGSEYYWRQVQIDNIWINDLNDGNGYVQEPYNLWFMYEGVAPYGVKAIDTITIVLFDAGETNAVNVTRWQISGIEKLAAASNLNGKELLYFAGFDFSLMDEVPYLRTPKDIESVFALLVANFGFWLSHNTGTSYKNTIIGYADRVNVSLNYVFNIE